MNAGQRSVAVLRAADISIDRRLALRVVRHCLDTKAELSEIVEAARRRYLDDLVGDGPMLSGDSFDEGAGLLH
jgi:hypothetical protein